MYPNNRQSPEAIRTKPWIVEAAQSIEDKNLPQPTEGYDRENPPGTAVASLSGRR